MANFVVTTNIDEFDTGASVGDPGGTGLSLREAIILSNESAGENTITFASGAGQAFEDDTLIRLTKAN